MDGTMQIHCRQTCPVWGQDLRDPVGVGDRTEALVMDHHIVALGPVAVRVQRNLALFRDPPLLDRFDDHPSPGLDASFENIFLDRIVVTASPADQQRTERPQLSGGHPSRQSQHPETVEQPPQSVLIFHQHATRLGASGSKRQP